MSREVRRVPADWQHPTEQKKDFRSERMAEKFKPLNPGEKYPRDAAGFIEKLNTEGLQEAVEYYGQAPDKNDYMPDWTEDQRTHLMMYEDTSKGTPISPAFKTPEELARWLVDNNASAFGGEGASYEGWLRVAKGGFAPSMIISNGRIESGVDAG